MTFAWLIYVSEARVPRGVDLSGLVTQSRIRNAALAITGSLIFTGQHFAQYLEGSAQSVDQLMTSIRADDRHVDLVVVATGDVADRRFATWTLCYAGPLTFAGRTVTAALHATTSGNEASVQRLILLLQDFARP